MPPRPRCFLPWLGGWRAGGGEAARWRRGSSRDRLLERGGVLPVVQEEGSSLQSQAYWPSLCCRLLTSTSTSGLPNTLVRSGVNQG